MLAWEGQVHGFYELLSRQVTDLLIPCQQVKWCSAVWTCGAIDFVCALLAEEVAILALYYVPLFWNVVTNHTLEGFLQLFLHLPLARCLRFHDGFVAGFFANPLQLRPGHPLTLS